jgi:hypothetical protein
MNFKSQVVDGIPQIDFTFWHYKPVSSHLYYCWPNYPQLERFYFVNIPKNASSTIRAWALKIKHTNGVLRNSTSSFTVLRDPYGRLKSAFAFALGPRYQYNMKFVDIANLFMGINLPESLTENQMHILPHFVPQHVFVENAPVFIEKYYSTGQIRELRHVLSELSGVSLPYVEENRSRYTQEFQIQYDNWFVANEDYIHNYLAKDVELYRKHIAI